MNAENLTNLLADGAGRGLAPGVLRPLGPLPLVADGVPACAGAREVEGFFAGLGRALAGELDPALPTCWRELYPWAQRPYLVAVDSGRVLVGEGERPVPLNLAEIFELNTAALLDYTAVDRHRQVSLLYAGSLCSRAQNTSASQGPGQPQLGQAPVLALTDRFEDFLCLGPIVAQGFENQEAGIAQVLAARAGGRWVGIRDYAAYGYGGSSLAYAWGRVLASAASLTAWHASAGFDPATGQATFATRAGWVRVSESGREIFPRTDPAVISAVTARWEGAEKILLGQARAWGPGRYSTFAGFVEGGEALESAVLREVYEECGGQVSAMRYLGSQPWPFPRSLMCGFMAEISNPQAVKPDGLEIERIRWFTRQELVRAYSSGEVQLPGTGSISRHLIEYWLGAPLPVKGER
ncbi:NAD(+) diphosphatase [Rothia sp. P4278]|uniref:NAD(+) diphosphatase n=1 Tax=unclassified Rothia (in: high G+C Gram-positive bacteria) TaxID=2689056 RepID=UPI003AEBA3A1